jgi:hypothetical protein
MMRPSSIASRANVRDDRETPLLVGRDARSQPQISEKRKSKVFALRLVGRNHLKGQAELAFGRTPFRRALATGARSIAKIEPN